MVHHLVWFKLKEGITPEEKSQLRAGLEGMRGQIPEILDLACGEDFSGRSRGFEWGLWVKFADKNGNDTYATHPAHLEFIANHKHLWVDVQALDFETP